MNNEKTHLKWRNNGMFNRRKGRAGIILQVDSCLVSFNFCRSHTKFIESNLSNYTWTLYLETVNYFFFNTIYFYWLKLIVLNWYGGFEILSLFFISKHDTFLLNGWFCFPTSLYFWICFWILCDKGDWKWITQTHPVKITVWNSHFFGV